MRSKGGLDVEETIPDLEKYLEDEDIADLAVAPARARTAQCSPRLMRQPHNSTPTLTS